MIKKFKNTDKLYIKTIVYLLIIALIWTFVILSNEYGTNIPQIISTKSINRINDLLDENKILKETYILNFDDTLLDHSKIFYENSINDVKMQSKNLETLRKNDRNYLSFIGHDIKNKYYERFYVDKNKFFDDSRKLNMAIIINSFVSRGISMYTIYSPRQFWTHSIKALLDGDDVRLSKTTKQYVLNSKKDGFSSTIFINKKTYLPEQIKINTKSKKLWHDESTFNNISIRVVDRQIIEGAKNSIIFELLIPPRLDKRVIKIQSHEEGEDTGDGLGEEICTSCHYKKFKIERFEQ